METTTSLDCRPLTGLVGAEVVGVDLSEPVSEGRADAIRVAVAKYGVIFFRRQELSTAEHIGVARALGELRDKTLAAEKAEAAEVGVISTENALAYQAAQWHTDSTAEICPPAYCVLAMQLRPEVGGDTMWSSQAAAYRGLSPRIQELLVGLTARHEYTSKHYEFTPQLERGGVDHPVVAVNPVSGEKALFVNPVFTTQVHGLGVVESKHLLAMLFEHSVRPEFTCRWRWDDGDIAIWNNPFVQHFAIHDYGAAARKIHRVEVEGVPMVAATA